MQTIVKSFAIMIALLGLTFGAQAQKVTYKADATKSQIKWTGKKVTGEHFGTVDLKSGTVEFDKGKFTGGTFVVDMTTIKVTDITDAGMAGKLKGHLDSDDFFSTSKFTTAELKVTKVTEVGKSKYNVTADLTIKGKKASVTFPASVYENAGVVTAVANVTIDRSKYDVKYGSGTFFEGLGDKMIYDDFYLTINIEAKK